jgi:small subunit ribosomal protein S9
MSETEAPTAAVETPVAETPAAETPAAVEEVRPLSEPAKPDRGGFVWGTGRRKSSVARVRVKPGEGKFLVNKRDVNEYFSEPQHKAACHKPLEITDTLGKLDVHVNVHGGGITGQAEAILLGVARALKGYDPTLEASLRGNNLLTRDPREVERKKPGQPGARKRFQFSKR